MELYFLRHGIAVDRDDPQYKNDSLRPLTPEGQKKMRRAARGMQALGLTFEAIFSSPYLRAKQTAEAVADAYKVKQNSIRLTKNLLPPAGAEDLLREILEHSPKAENVLCVGHEPHLSQNVSCLLKSAGPLAIDFKKGGLCGLSIDLRQKTTATLNWLLTPSQLALIAA